MSLVTFGLDPIDTTIVPYFSTGIIEVEVIQEEVIQNISQSTRGGGYRSVKVKLNRLKIRLKNVDEKNWKEVIINDDNDFDLFFVMLDNPRVKKKKLKFYIKQRLKNEKKFSFKLKVIEK